MDYPLIYSVHVEHAPETDDEPAVFVASQEELGLVAKAKTRDALVKKVQDLAPILVEENIFKRTSPALAFVDLLPDGQIEVRARPKTGTISDIFGMLGNPHDIHLTIDEINEVIAKAWAGER